MPAWLIPALKAVLPHVGTIVSAATPVFTKKSGNAPPDQSTLQQQITELQTAASGNDAHIKELAAQIQSTVETLEKGAALAEARHRWMLLLCIAALILSAAALSAALFVLVAR